MISTLIGLLGIAGYGGGALGIVGVALKVLGRFAPSAAATVLSNPFTAALGKVAEGFVDLVAWAAKGVLGYVGAWLAGGFDHISKDARSFAILMIACWGAYQVGGWGKPYPPPPAVSPPVTRSAPAKALPRTSVPQPVRKQETTPFDPFGWITNHFR